MSERCPLCGADYALVGRAHLCRELRVPVAKKPADSVTNSVTNKSRASAAQRQARKRERDPEKYRAYQRELMARRRAEQK
jgi:hypothetical protein